MLDLTAIATFLFPLQWYLINNFLGNAIQLPPLFTTKEDIPIIQSFIREFGAASDEDPSRYRVYPLHHLFFDVKEEAVRNSIDGALFRSIHLAEDQLRRDRYAHLRDTACNVSPFSFYLMNCDD